MTATRLEPFFIDGDAGRLFMLLRAPADASRCVLFVPPFGEEMNKCRRQFTLTVQALNECGYGALLVDLYGTGDSEGEFSEARWEIWTADVDSALRWAVDHDLSVEALIATRLGCMLAAHSLRQCGHAVRKSVFWQPTASGKQFMTQFLRLRVAASMMEADQKETVEQLRSRLAENEIIEVAGYRLPGQLCSAIDKLDLADNLTPSLGEVLISEVGRSSDGDLSPGGRRLLKELRELGLSVVGRRVPGDPFWTATEIVTNAMLVTATVDFLTAEVADE